eukprot:1137916-Pelagomonas_calceolata.AAC.2
MHHFASAKLPPQAGTVEQAEQLNYLPEGQIPWKSLTCEALRATLDGFTWRKEIVCCCTLGENNREQQKPKRPISNVCNIVEVEKLLVLLVFSLEHHICIVDPAQEKRKESVMSE